MRYLKSVLLVLLSCLITTSAYADAPHYIDIGNNQTVFGYERSINGKKYIIKCDPNTGKETGFALMDNGKYVTKEMKILDGYELAPDLSITKKLYPTENYPSPLWKGQVSIAPLWDSTWDWNSKYSYYELKLNPLVVNSPYSNPPDYWHWLIFNVMNPNPWPVVSHVYCIVGSNKYEKDVRFEANETKQLKMDVVAGENEPIAISCEIIKNLDPDAPSEPVDYINHPPADDGGPTWGVNQFNPVEITIRGHQEHYSEGLYGLVPAFKQIPVWNPESEDGHWGHLSFNTTPAYEWKVVGRLGASKTFGVVNKGFDFEYPYVQSGSIGPWQPNPPSGPYQEMVKWEATNYSTLVNSGTGPFPENLYPNKIIIASSHYGPDIYYTDASKSQLITYLYNWQAPEKSEWKVFSKTSQRSGVCLPGDDEDKNGPVKNKDDTVTVYTSAKGYVPIYGSYLKVGPTVHNIINYKDYGYSQIYYLFNHIFNPTDNTITFTITEGYIDNRSRCSVPSGSVTIAPHSYGVIPLTFNYSGSKDYGLTLPQFYVFPDGSGKKKSPAFYEGACAPLQYEALGWRVDGVKCNAIAYDKGLLHDNAGETYTVNLEPSIDGSMIQYEKTMTVPELQKFYWTSKVQEVINTGMATWSIESKILMEHDDDSSRMRYQENVRLVP